ncbi:MAG: glycoside hydrolase family 3 C-terminal domain-containing protein [Christensenellaceae bacterium]|jgi:beta-glucosidase|nr:glycoside hydrolase family 3 C-terminal domain-containing protein [Christensenellaceae bacterium]
MLDIEKIITELTLEEKCSMLSGKSSWENVPCDRLNIPSVWLADGPHGVRMEEASSGGLNLFTKSKIATCFPTASAMASTWNTELVKSVGEALGAEAKNLETNILLGPGVNIKRHPLCGRNFEYFSEDPLLAGKIAAAYINGVQSQGTGTSLKHYAANSQEFCRHSSDSIIDERTLRELYLTAFEIAVAEGDPWTIMCCYNLVNGVQGSENEYLLNDILREEWGYKGVVVSDWGAVYHREKGVKAGLDLEMPNSNGETDKEVEAAVKNGTLSEEFVDKCIKRLLNLINRCLYNAIESKPFSAEKSYETAYKAALEGAILLKNDGVLPLKKDEPVYIVGEFAKVPRIQGLGSSGVSTKPVASLLDSLDAVDIPYLYSQGFEIDSEKTSNKLLGQAVTNTRDAKTVVFFGGLPPVYEAEGFDRYNMSLPQNQITLINALINAGKEIILILVNGSPVVLPFIDKLKAVLTLNLSGEKGSFACRDLIFGDASPSGKTAETYPLAQSDVPSDLNFQTMHAEYKEGLFVGYRYYDSANKPVLFPFGYGLSYTEFEYSDLLVIQTPKGAEVTFTLKNIGNYDGAEAAQIYVKAPGKRVYAPVHELRGFTKVFLRQGESKTVTVELNSRAFEYYDTVQKAFVCEGGEYTIEVGTSSRNIKLTAAIEKESTLIGEGTKTPETSVYRDISKLTSAGVPDADWKALLNRDVAPYKPPKKGEYDFNTSIGELRGFGLASIFRVISVLSAPLVLPKDATKANKFMARAAAPNMPLRQLYLGSKGVVSKGMLEGLILAFNGHFFKGISGLLKAMKNKPQK